MASDDRSGELVGVLAFFMAVCTILVVLRCYCKMFIVKAFGSDDYCCIISLIAFLAFCILGFLGIANGTGKKKYLIPDDKYPEGMKWWWSCEPVYMVHTFFLKLSIGIFLLRIAVERAHRIILWIVLIAVELYTVFFCLLFIFQCRPINLVWEIFRGGTGSCIPRSTQIGAFYGFSVISCIADWTFSIIPIFIVYKLQMSRRKKITVAILLGLCAIGSTATIIRIPYVQSLNNEAEFLYATIDIAIWATCEGGIGIATSAAATLRPLLRQVFGESVPGSASNKQSSRNWGGNSRSRLGYIHQTDTNNEIGIPLKDQDNKTARVHSGDEESNRSRSTTGLRDWEHEKEDEWQDDRTAGVEPQFGAIVKTTRITQQ